MSKIKLSDYVIQFIENLGIKHVFLISGGGCIHLVDSLGSAKKLKYICNHHEQACSIAAEGYGRTTNNLGVCIVTSGPGSTNAITGVMGAWVDSIPMLIISGQVKRETIGAGKNLRQFGDQEINIIDIVKPITKYAKVVMMPKDIKYHLKKSIYLAKSGRPGPVWLDIPLDVQGSIINTSHLKEFDSRELEANYEIDKEKLKKIVAFTLKKILNSDRPILFVGNGVRFSGAEDRILKLIKLLKIPVLTGYAGFDLVSTNNPYFAGHPGSFGQRAGNFAMQNSDLMLIIGSRLNVRMTGFNFNSFARKAYKIMVDIDKRELNKKSLKIDLKANYNAKDFINEMIYQLEGFEHFVNKIKWMRIINSWKKKYIPVPTKYWKDKKYVNPYCFIETLSKLIKSNDGISLSNATSQIVAYQALNFSQGLRVLNNSGCAAMGYGLPASIGMCFARGTKKTICLEGDGSIQLNIQELQTIVHYNLPIKIFVFSNKGYVSIRLTQEGLFNGKLVASSPETGVSIPNMIKIAKAYGIPCITINNNSELKTKIKKVLSGNSPFFCEVKTSPDQKFYPKASSMKLPNGSFVSRPLEDMQPLLSREELKSNMYIPLWEK